MIANVVHGATLTSRCGSTLPLQISDARAVQLVTAGNDRGGLRDRFRPPEPEWLLSAIASSSSSVEYQFKSKLDQCSGNTFARLQKWHHGVQTR